MNHTQVSGYGLWGFAIINAAIFITFAFSFTRPKTKRDWRSLGAFSAFILALFTEMYGFPLTIYLLSGWLTTRYPAVNWYGHESGHLWHTLLGMNGNPHFDVLHLLSNVFVFGGFVVLASAWRVLYAAQRTHQLATAGVYSYIRHPQYAAFILIMVGFLLQWPTLITLVMFPILVYMYVALARREEREVLAEFGEGYAQYAAATPRFFPRLWHAKPYLPTGPSRALTRNR
jgi:protein-S-isoprenylcysteine O-methyltransferase Ste14